MSGKMYLLALAAAILFVVTCARPSEERAPRQVDLSQVMNRTVCPIKVEIDENPDRLPRRIKMMRCAENSQHWCRAQNIPDHECCLHSHDNHVMTCVEMRDTVMVFYKDHTEPSTYEVSVGCTCMIEDATTASDVPNGPP